MSKIFGLCRYFDGNPDAFPNRLKHSTGNTPEFSYIADVHLHEFWQCKCIQAIEELNQPSIPGRAQCVLNWSSARWHTFQIVFCLPSLPRRQPANFTGQIVASRT